MSLATSLRDAITLLDPQAGGRKSALAVVAAKGTRKPRDLKVFKNPQTGEIVKIKGGNHKLLKAWTAEYGSDEVEPWLAK